MFYQFEMNDGSLVGFDEDDMVSVEVFMDIFDEYDEITSLMSTSKNCKIICNVSGSTVELLKYQDDNLVEHKRTYYTAFCWLDVTD